MSESADKPATRADFEARLDAADTAVAQFGTRTRTPLQVVLTFLRNYPTMIPATVLVISVAVFGAIAPRFLSMGAMSTVMQQMTVTGFIALAQTIVILTAGIELSVAEILVLSSLVIGNLAVFPDLPDTMGWPLPLAIGAGILLGGVMGMFNGVLVAKLKLPPFIVTLGTLSIFRAIKLAYSNSESIRNADIVKKANDLLFFGNGFKIGTGTVTYGMIALLVMSLIVWYALNRTAWGRHVHAIGDDPDAARLSGIHVERTLISVYTASGLICGFTAWVAIGRVGSVTPIGFENINLASITAVVIGGTSLFGGRGSVLGAVLGAIIVQVFTTGLSLAGVDDYWQTFAAGCLVIIAVTLDQYLRRASQ